jgi:2-polyprenyl-3-methyl-5-hydroxy-6-metoxy-1,4-benzoquinol methylase
MDRDGGTRHQQYSERLISKESIWWKRLLDVQAPYRWNLRRLNLGFTLDVGCGLGRNLAHLDGNGVGIDHNATSVEVAKSRGLLAYLPEEFEQTEHNKAGRFDSILIAHVLEHMTEPQAGELLGRYVPLLKAGGRAVLITPQERGFKSDPTHVEFLDFSGLRRIAEAAGLVPERAYSFPFPRPVGKVFTHNEFVSTSTKPLA